MRLLDYEGLRSKGIKWSKPHLWRKERAGEFPERVPLGLRSHGWDEEDIDAWLAARKQRASAGWRDMTRNAKTITRDE